MIRLDLPDSPSAPVAASAGAAASHGPGLRGNARVGGEATGCCGELAEKEYAEMAPLSLRLSGSSNRSFVVVRARVVDTCYA